MNFFLTAFLLLAFSQTFMAQTDDEYKKLFRDKIEFDRSGSSIVAAFVDEKGTRFVSYGKLSKDAAATNANEATIYEIGSLTKLFTGVLLADAVNRGEVKLNEPISKYLPNTVTVPSFNGKEITLLDLATHTSSLPRLPNNLDLKNPAPYAGYTAQNLYDFLSNYKLTREIGSQYEYSNLGVGLLGHILSLRGKMSLEKLMTVRIFKTLGMNDSSFSLTDAKKTRHAQGYTYKNELAPLWFFDSLAGGGAIRSTSSDMAKFISAAVGITKTPLANAFIEARKPQRQGRTDATKIGLCWNNFVLSGTEIFWHGGGTSGFRSYIAISPEQKKGAFLVSNADSDEISSFNESVAFNYLQPKFPIEKTRIVISLPEDILQKYVGEYQLAPDFSIIVTLQGNRLFAQATGAGQGNLELFAEKEDEFFVKALKADISFTKNADGKIDGLILRQNGRNSPAKKVK